MSALAAALGLAPGARAVVLHQDDVGMCHGANLAFLSLARAGRIGCGSAMVPCPWFPEIAEAAAADPGLDLGIHLTLTSEWRHYRWGPVSTRSRASGLIDDDGYFPRRCPDLARRVVPEAAEAEMRAQIERALAAGLRPTHLDTHMGAALLPALRGAYLALGREYGLPVLLPRDHDAFAGVLEIPRDAAGWAALVAAEEASGRPPIDSFRMTPGVPSAEAEGAYRTLLTALPPGVTFVALHCNAPGDIEAIVPDRAHWRTDEAALFASGLPAAWLAAEGIPAIGMRAVRQAIARAGTSPPPVTIPGTVGPTGPATRHPAG